jgi:GMP synthase (glutamine-hydrolysing)
MHKILVLDFGSQYTQLIARRVRELNVYCEIWPFNRPLEQIKAFGASGLILSGGPSSVFDKDAPDIDVKNFELGIPVLGICYGLQLMVHKHGGRVASSEKREYGRAQVHIQKQHPLFEGLATARSTFEAWMSHGDQAKELPADFEVLATTDTSPFAAVAHKSKPWFGVQFHPEVAHTPRGRELLSNFLFGICKAEADWTMAHFLDEETKRIRALVKPNEKVLCALSGGVDSSVVAALLAKAIPDQLVCVFVDTGLQRANERAQVESVFREHFKVDLRVIDATKRFFTALAGVTDPEVKRKRIGHLFIEVFEEVAKPMGATYLAQGTLYPDVIESVSVNGPSVTIKSHHNVGGLPEKMNLKLVEPLRELFKDEVRVLGRELGLPDRIVMRQPFPGPGMAVRVVGEVTEEGVRIVQQADLLVEEELTAAGHYQGLWQAFAVLLPVKSVGVQGDNRTYAQTVSVRAVTSTDGMTADVADIPVRVLSRLATRIMNEVRGVNRVVYDVSQKPPSTIEWE